MILIRFSMIINDVDSFVNEFQCFPLAFIDFQWFHLYFQWFPMVLQWFSMHPFSFFMDFQWWFPLFFQSRPTWRWFETRSKPIWVQSHAKMKQNCNTINVNMEPDRGKLNSDNNKQLLLPFQLQTSIPIIIIIHFFGSISFRSLLHCSIDLVVIECHVRIGYHTMTGRPCHD